MPGFVWTSARIAEALGLPLEGRPGRTYAGVSTDTRKLRSGELFVALKGENFDGADFMDDAVEAGAAGAVVTAGAQGRPRALPDDFELFVVPDTLVALGKLANARRRALGPVVVAITGTNGKTTTRRLLSAALGPQAAESPANFNNLVGVPLSMLSASEDARWWVLELASNQPGEISRLSRIAEPSVGLITSIGEGHLEGLGDLEGVLEEKLGLLDGLDESGHLFVADRPEVLARSARERFASVTTVGVGDEADERPEQRSLAAEGTGWTWRATPFHLPGFGLHLVKNGLMAAAVAAHLGVDPADAAQRMAAAEMPPMRGDVRQVGGLTLLVDCYNANPSSFEVAVESLKALAADRQRAVVAGTMLELGDRSAELHARVARQILASKVALLVATGAFADAARDLDASGERLIVEPDIELAYDRLVQRLAGDEVVLLKGSRGVRLERLIPRFERDFGLDGNGLEA